MKSSLFPALAAGLMLATAPVASLPAAAQVVKGMAVVDYNEVVANSNAYKTAQQQRPVTYKAQIEQAEARTRQLQAQLKPMGDKFNADRQAANPNQAALQAQLQQIQQIEEAGQAEIQKILAPVTLSRAYVNEQIGDQLDEAVKRVMNRQKISIVITPQQVVAAAKDYYINDAVTAELNTLLPSAQLVPPPGWLPRELREQVAAMEAAQAGQDGAVTQPTQPAGPAPQGR